MATASGPSVAAPAGTFRGRRLLDLRSALLWWRLNRSRRMSPAARAVLAEAADVRA
jgi:hypothetical protein